jgi:hypothetical protein
VGYQSIYVPLIELPEAQGGELVFNSRSTKEMPVTPIFYKRDGSTVVGKTVNVRSGEIRYADVKSLLPAARRDEYDWGGMSLNYYGGNREIWSQFRFMGVGGGSSVDEFFIVRDESRSEVQDAVWWMPRRSRAIIALGNITDAATSATVTFGDGRTQEVELRPHATEILRGAQSKDGGSESVRINVTGAPGSVVPTGIITTKDNSFNSVIRFYDTKHTKQPRLFANGLRVVGTALHMALKNTTPAPITAQPKFIPSGGNDAGTVILPEVNLGPNETTEVDLTYLSQQAASRTDLDVVSVQIANSGESGSLIGSIYGIDTASGVAYDVPLRDSGPVRSMTGAYPWKISADYSTVAYVTNITDREAEYVAQINFDGGKFTLAPHKLMPGETAAFDFRKMRDEQMQDAEGRTLPADVTIGQFMWAMRGTTGGKLVLIGRAEMVSRSRKVSTSYSCPTDCGLTYDVIVDPAPDPGFVTGTSIGAGWETGYSNQGYTVGPYKTGGQWSVDYPVATFSDAGNGDEMATGTASGSASFTLFVGMQEVYDFDGLNCVDVGPQPEQTGGSMNVVPHIDSITPMAGLVGTTVDVVIKGKGFSGVSGAGPLLNTMNGISTSIQSSSDTEIHARFTIDVNTSGGNREVAVSTSGAGSSNGLNFLVQIPTRLAPTFHINAPSGVGPLKTPVDGDVRDLAGTLIATHQCGVYRNYAYALLDQTGGRITQAFTISEEFVDFEGSFGAPTAVSATIGVNSVVPDIQALTLSYPRCLQSGENQTFIIGYTVTVGGRSFDLTTLNHVQRGMINGELKVDVTTIQQ